MYTYKLKWTRLESEIFRYLCINAGTKINQRGIAKDLQISPTSVAKALRKLKEKNLVSEERHKLINLISWELNRDNNYVINLKRIENLKLIYESGLLSYLEEIFTGSTIILFGSYSRGEDILTSERESDIDIAIIGKKEKPVNLDNFERKLKRKIILNFYSSLKSIHTNLRNNILNGIVLLGGIDL